MSARILDGTSVARTIRDELREGIAAFAQRAGRAPALDIVICGDNPASQIYVRNKERAGKEAGIAVSVHRLPATVPPAEVLALVGRLSSDERCDGILVQSPLPPHFGRTEVQRVFEAVSPAKDVDGFHPQNVGRLVQGRARLTPCTPSGIIELLERERVAVAGQHAVVIGRSEIVGKPMALLLLLRDATVTVCHSKTRHIATVARQADILVAAVGLAGFVTRDFVRPGATVIDVGINRIDERETAIKLFGPGHPRVRDFDRRGSLVVGDVHPSAAEIAGAITPVPGGVGPLTIAMLLKNTLTAAVDRAQNLQGS